MMKPISVVDWLLKKDHTGRRVPTPLLWAVVIVFVFGSYFITKNKKSEPKINPNTEIIKERDLIEVANVNWKKKSENFTLDQKELFKPLEDAKNNLMDKGVKNKIRKSSKSQMIVYDNTDNHQSEMLLPLGSMVKCLLIHNIVTNNFNSPVIAQVWQDFYFDDELLLPFGTRIYGTAFAGRERDRVMVKFHSIVFQDGKTIKIDGIGMSKDGSGGITGTVINNRNKKLFIEMAVNFLSGLAVGLQETATNTITGLNQTVNNSRNAILEGVAETFQKEASRIQRETESAKGYAVVLAGSELVVFFEKPTDINPL